MSQQERIRADRRATKQARLIPLPDRRHTASERRATMPDRRTPKPDRIAERSRTLWAAAAVAMLGVVQASTDILKTLVSEQAFGWILVGVGVLMAGLRVITTQPIGRRK